MNILGIETSCDDSCVAIVKNGKKILSNIIQNQNEFHQYFNGIVPEIASRKHLQNLLPTIHLSLKKSSLTIKDIDLIAVTQKPGLVGSLLMGLSTAKALAYSFQKKIIPVNHLLAHIYSPQLEYNVPYPHLSLLVSGGHTMLVKALSPTQAEIIGSTLDDSCGECFDKIAKYLNLGFPGGAIIEKKAFHGDSSYYNLPISFIKTHDKNKYNFSYSGLKTASINLIKNEKDKNTFQISNFLASFQKQAIKPLIIKLKWASQEYNIKNVSICGGVARNSFFREEIKKLNLNFFIPNPNLCTDNAAMIAGLAFHLSKYKKNHSKPPYKFYANPASFKNQTIID